LGGYNVGFADVLKWKHKESVENYITGVTADGLIDIVEGEWNIGNAVWIPVAIKVEYYKRPCWRWKERGRIATTFDEGTANYYKGKRRKVVYDENNHSYKVHPENMGSDGVYCWWCERNEGRIRIPELDKILAKVERLSK